MTTTTTTAAAARSPSASHSLQPPPEQPPLNPDVVKLAGMTARQRVQYAAKLQRQLSSGKDHRPSSVFASATGRLPFAGRDFLANGAAGPSSRPPSEHQLRREAIVSERRQRVLSRANIKPEEAAADGVRGASVDPSRPALGDGPRSARGSSWARDTTPRGIFLLCRGRNNGAVPSQHVDPTPGPGAYTPALHFAGGFT